MSSTIDRMQEIEGWLQAQLSHGPIPIAHITAGAKQLKYSLYELTAALRSVGGYRIGGDKWTIAASHRMPAAESILPPPPVAANAFNRAADERRAAIEAAASDRGRCHAILHCPEAEGRERLAAHIAYQTDCSVKEARGHLAAANLEPGSRPAVALQEAALARSILDAGKR